MRQNVEVDTIEEYQKGIEEQLADLKGSPILNHWNETRRLNNFNDLKKEFRRCRNTVVGRRISAALQLKSDNQQYDSPSYTVHMNSYGSVPFMRFTSDNIVEFVATPEEVWSNSQSLVTSLCNWLPFMIWRHRKGLYRVQHYPYLLADIKAKMLKQYDTVLANIEDYYEMDKHLPPYSRNQFWHLRWKYEAEIMRQSPSYFQGLKFDMTTGKCLNQKHDDQFVEKPEERKVWRRALTKFKRGIRARAKIRAFDPMVEKIWAERADQSRYHWKQPDWSSKSWLDLLENCIRDNSYPQELLKGLCMSSNTGYYQQEMPTSSDVYKATDKVLTDMSIELRRRFNVFEKEGHYTGAPHSQWLTVDHKLKPSDLK